MCTGKCSRYIAVNLYPLVLLSIICNLVLFFPGGSTKYIKEGHVTAEVYYLGGLLGGGILILIPAVHFHFAGNEGCCGNRIGMFLSITAAAVGVAGALYSFTVAVLGLANGPLCKTQLGNWGTPYLKSNTSYLTDHRSWAECTEPSQVVQFNLGLFFTLMAASCLQGVLCAIQMINGLFGCLFGTCSNKGVE